MVSTSDYSFGVSNPTINEFIQKPYPAIILSGTETNGGISQILELAGATWIVTNALYQQQYGGFVQQNAALPSSAIVQLPNGQLEAAFAPAGAPIPIVWTFTLLGGESLVFDVVAYGAVGDASSSNPNPTDDTAAIQAAMNAAGLVGGIVYFPQGIYGITRPLYPPSGITLRGVGSYIVVNTPGNGLDQVAIGSIVRIINPTANYPNFNFSGMLWGRQQTSCTDLTVIDLCFDANSRNAPSSYWVGNGNNYTAAIFNAYHRWLIERVHFFDANAQGCACEGPPSMGPVNVKLIDCQWSLGCNADALSTASGATGVQVVRGRWNPNWKNNPGSAGGTMILSQTSYNTMVEDCLFLPNNINGQPSFGGGGAGKVTFQGVNGGHIRGNQFVSGGWVELTSNYHYPTNARLFNCMEVQVHNNYFSADAHQEHTSGSIHVHFDNARFATQTLVQGGHIILDNNTIDGTDGPGILWEGDTEVTSIGGSRISDCLIANANLSGAAVSSGNPAIIPSAINVLESFGMQVKANTAVASTNAYQNYGICMGRATTNNAIIGGVTIENNTTGETQNGLGVNTVLYWGTSPYTPTPIFRNNGNFNPVGTPPLPHQSTPNIASGLVIHNNTGFDMTVYIAAAAGASVTVIKVNGVTTGLTLAASTSGQVLLYAGETIELTYTGTVSWVWAQ